MKPIEQYFEEAVLSKRAVVDKQRSELAELERLARRSKAVSVIWNAPINYKNSARAVQQAQILQAYRDHASRQRVRPSLEGVKLSTIRLWRLTQRAPCGKVKPAFRGQIIDLKRRGYLEQSECGSAWRLTKLGLRSVGNE